MKYRSSIVRYGFRSVVTRFVRYTLTLFLLSVSLPLQADQTVRLVGDPFPPYVNGDLGHDANSGIAVEIARKIFSSIDAASVRFPLIPWNRALREVEIGTSDGIGLLLKTAERDKYMQFSIPLLEGKSLVWSTTAGGANPFKWNRIEDLSGLRVGVTQGYSYGTAFDQSVTNGDIEVISAPTVELLFAMLANGRVDLAIANDAVGYALTREYPQSAIEPAEKIIDVETFYIGISRQSPALELIPQIDQAIKILHESGEIDRIIRGE